MTPEFSSEDSNVLLGPGEMVFIKSENNGHVSVWTGPCQNTLEQTEHAVRWDADKRIFVKCAVSESKSPFVSADEGQYVVLTNPVSEESLKDGKDEHPSEGSKQGSAKLAKGSSVVIPGPVSFALWPEQKAKVIDGHTLRSNEYLVAKVTNEKAANDNWGEAVLKETTSSEETPAPEKDPNTGSGDEAPPEEDTSTADESAAEEPKDSPASATDSADEIKSVEDRPEFSMGQRLIIKGTDVSFFIPPTGIQIVPSGTGKYVRDAVTLEVMEYCVLRDEKGGKRFEQGPAVVFPTPTEVFVEKDGRRKFRAVELNNDMGVHIKTTQACADDDGTERGPGEEIFITGKKQKIYWPKPEHAVVKYGDDDTGVTFAIAIPDGEGKYALQKATGNVVLIRGHQMFLPDPTQEVVVQRVLDPAVVELLYPDNAEAMAFNDRLRASRVGAAPIELPRLRRGSHKGLGLSESYIEDELGMPQNFESLSYSRSTAPVLEQAVGDGFGGDEISRKTSHTPPREITLDNKYTGAVAVDVWPNFCILLVTKKGERRTVVGPKTVLLDYDEVPASLELSTETPKTDAHTLRTAYLQIEANKVSDEIHAETSDMVKVRIKLSYRVNFEGDNKRWFNMRNYVKVLTDHLRSLVQCLVSRHGIAEFQKNARDIIRNAILGEKPAEGDRPGRSFSENGMRVYEVDFDTIEVRDQSIAARLVEAQHSAVTRSIEISDAEGDRETNARLQEIQREKQRDADVTAQEAHKLRLEAAGRSQEADLLSVEHSKATQLANIQADSEAAELQATAKLVAQDAQDVIADKIRDSKMKDASQRLEIAEHDQNLQVDLMEKEVAEVVAQAGAISPRLVAAMETMGTKKLAEELVVALGPEAIASGQSVVSVLKKLVGDGTVSTLLDGLFKGFKSDAVNSSTDSGAE